MEKQKDHRIRLNREELDTICQALRIAQTIAKAPTAVSSFESAVKMATGDGYPFKHYDCSLLIHRLQDLGSVRRG